MKKQTGITLIALIITIIVLLILAGVTINLTLGEKGIFKTAQRAVQNYKDAQDQELAYLNYFEAEMNNTIKGLGSSSVASGSTSTTTPPTPPPVTYQAYNVGDTVTLNNNGTQETFYVIKPSSSNESTVTLFAKDAIDPSTLKQFAGRDPDLVYFSNERYWDVDKEYDLNNYPIPEGEKSAVKIAKDYGNRFGAIGRLITVVELEAVVDFDWAFLGEDETDSVEYWLGTSVAFDPSYPDDSLWVRYAWIGAFGPMIDWGEPEYIAAVRPVIEISKTKI